MDKEYILYCDESEKSGKYYSNFYGGVLVGASQYERIISVLKEEKEKLNLFGEVKWSKVTERYFDKYDALIRFFFAHVKAEYLKIRIMFRQNAHVPVNLTTEDLKNQYFKLYYQFIKHAYGLEHAELNNSKAKIRLYFDMFPENREAVSRFKEFLLALNKNQKINDNGISIKEEDISEVESHDHVLLQCLDIILGAIHFRLNDKHLEKQPGCYRRAKRTIAKEKLYKTILSEIKSINPKFKHFNIGMSTSASPSEKWTSPYLHWNFVPKNSIFYSELGKQKNGLEKEKPQPVYTNL